MRNGSVLECLPGIWKAQKSIPGTTKEEIKKIGKDKLQTTSLQLGRNTDHWRNSFSFTFQVSFIFTFYLNLKL